MLGGDEPERRRTYGTTELSEDDPAQPRRTPRFSSLAAPFISASMRRANNQDLARLKALLEALGQVAAAR